LLLRAPVGAPQGSLQESTWEREQRVLDLVLRHGWNATAFQTIEDGYHYFFHGDAYVAYVDTGTAWVAAGAPVASDENLRSITQAFADAARTANRRCCFFGVERRLLDSASVALRALPIGDQAVWDPRQWNAMIAGNTRLRGQHRRTSAKGVLVRCLGQGEFETNAVLRTAIHDLENRWLASHRMPTMGFLVRLGDSAFSEHRRCFVAEQSGRLVGLAYVLPVPRREGWFIEHLVRSPDAPNGTMELVVDKVLRWAAAQGSPWLSLGLAPLSGDVPLPLRIARKRLAFLYNFAGLHHFKAKLCPSEWIPLHVAYPHSQGPVMTVIDVLAAFAQNRGHGGKRLPAKDYALPLGDRRLEGDASSQGSPSA